MKAVLAVAAGMVIAIAVAAAAQTVRIDGVEVVGTILRVNLSDGRTLSGGALVGAVLGLDDEAGAAKLVKIEAIAPDPMDRSGEVFLYRFATLDASGHWQPMCPPDPYGRQLGIPQPGADGKVAIWCTSGALAKCIRLGYHPWQRRPDGTSLATYHRACVEMVRADYAGDDRATTRDGMLIDVFDHVGINPPAPGPGAMPFEAAWGESGAICVAHVRVPQNVSLDQLVETVPRFRGRVGEACTETTATKWGEPLLFNRSRGDGIPGR